MSNNMTFKIEDSSLEKLKENSINLNKSTDELNKIITEIENRLIDMKLGVTAWVEKPVVINSIDGEDREYFIGFTRFNFDWRIVSMIKKDNKPSKNIVPLLYTNRVVRMAACSVLEDLILALNEKTEKFISDVNNAKNLVEKSEIVKNLLNDDNKNIEE